MRAPTSVPVFFDWLHYELPQNYVSQTAILFTQNLMVQNLMTQLGNLCFWSICQLGSLCWVSHHKLPRILLTCSASQHFFGRITCCLILQSSHRALTSHNMRPLGWPYFFLRMQASMNECSKWQKAEAISFLRPGPQDGQSVIFTMFCPLKQSQSHLGSWKRHLQWEKCHIFVIILTHLRAESCSPLL